MSKSKKAAPKHKVFVYGTLRPVIDGSIVPVTHRLNDYTMYSAGAYPYIKSSIGDDDTFVLGNIIEVTRKELFELDRYEGVDSGLYTRERETVYALNVMRQAVEVFVYVAGPLLVPQPIASGDWYNR